MKIEKFVTQNGNYLIVDVCQIKNSLIVLAQHISEENNFVTWRYTDKCGFFWGHYFTSEDHAKIDFYERISFACNYEVDIIKGIKLSKNE